MSEEKNYAEVEEYQRAILSAASLQLSKMQHLHSPVSPLPGTGIEQKPIAPGKFSRKIDFFTVKMFEKDRLLYCEDVRERSTSLL